MYLIPIRQYSVFNTGYSCWHNLSSYISTIPLLQENSVKHVNIFSKITFKLHNIMTN